MLVGVRCHLVFVAFFRIRSLVLLHLLRLALTHILCAYTFCLILFFICHALCSHKLTHVYANENTQPCLQLFDLGDPANKGRVSKTGFRHALEVMSVSGVSLLKMTTEDMEVRNVHSLRT